MLNTKNTIISVKHLTKIYGSFTAVNDISFDVMENEVFGLLGPNGAGKTSTLEILETLRKKDSGKIHIAGFDMDNDAISIKRIIGVQLQSSDFFRTLSLKDVIILFAGLYNVEVNPMGILERVSLQSHAHKKFKQLSGGQQQRFSLAITFINKPKIIFLDEPTTGLDPQSRQLLWKIIREVQQEGVTIMLTTHYMDEAENLCDRIGIMNAGKIMEIDTPSNLIDKLLAKGFTKKVEIKKANLEDVFLNLTGHQLKEG